MAQTLDFSIVIPTYQRHGPLMRLLRSLTLLDYNPERFEVIVVDDGSDLPLDNVIRRFASELNIIFLKQENSGPAAARNKGSQRAQGKYLAFIDDDCAADPYLLKAMRVSLEEHPGSACGGKVANAFPDNPYSAATQVLMDYLYDHYSPLIHHAGFFPAANLSVPREIFLEMGGFDPTLRFGEDRDFCYRWSSLGYPFASVPDAIVFHYHALKFYSLLSLHFSYGGGTFQFWKRHGRGVLRMTTLNPPRWHLNLVFSGLRNHGRSNGLLSSVLLGFIQGSCAAGVFWEWVRTRTSWLTS